MSELKYGIVYIWYDTYKKMFYIGAHWGLIDDGYICSSRWMNSAYNKRPENFKRKILKFNIKTKEEMFLEENKWLFLIKDEELGKRYYNLQKHWKHWSRNENTEKKAKENIKNSYTPEIRKKLSEDKLGDKNPMKRPEVIQKRLKTISERIEPIIPWNKGLTLETSEKVQKIREKRLKTISERIEPIIPWNKGMKMSKEYCMKISKKEKGHRWAYDPETKKEFKFYKDQDIPENLIRGKINHDYFSQSNKNTKYYVNKFTGKTIRLKGDDIIPEGYVLGRKLKEEMN